MGWMHSSEHPPVGNEPLEPASPRPTASLVRVLAPTPDFLPPLEGESAMLLHVLGQAFTDLMERC